MNSNIGDRIGDYEVVGILGAGGMGKVYKVRNVISDRVEAIKVLLPELTNVPELADRFLREIKVLATLEHPHIAALRTAQRIDNQLVMVMELVEGVTVEDKLKNGPLPVDQAVDIVAQVLSALSYAHARGVIHRDIKPANMMVTEGGVVKLMDFGIAKAAGDRKLTMTGTTLGSLFYMSPEQIKGGELDPRSDLYSLGVSLYEMVTGARPFKGDSDFSIMSAHLEMPPVPPIEVDPRLPAALNEIILMAIVKDPAKRFQSATAFGAAIGSVGGRVPSAAAARPPQRMAAAAASSVPTTAPPRSGSSRRGLYMALGAVVVVLVLVAGAIVVPRVLRTRAGESPASAQQEAPLPAASAEQQPAPSQPAATEPVPVQESGPVASQPAASKAGAGQTPTPSRPPTQPSAQPQTRQQLQPQAQQYAQPQSQVPAQQPAAAQPAAQPPAADLAKAAALRETQKAWPMLASRAGAVSSSLQNLQQAQQRSGLGLRGDISASWKRMEHYMDQAEAAISAKDPALAQEHMESAEREIQTLEKFLGR
jgi:serine/threonine-protein kinase